MNDESVSVIYFILYKMNVSILYFLCSNVYMYLCLKGIKKYYYNYRMRD